MILDLQSMFSDAQLITGTAVSTNVIDFGLTEAPIVRSAPAVGTIVRDQGKGTPSPILIQVGADFDALTSLTIVIQASVDEAFSSPVVVDTQSVLLADLVAGYQGNLQWYPTGANLRFGRIAYTVVGSNPTVGNITAGLSMGNQTNP